MQNMLKFGLKTLFLLVVLLGVGAIYSIDQSQTYGRLINYVGIVRSDLRLKRAWTRPSAL